MADNLIDNLDDGRYWPDYDEQDSPFYAPLEKGYYQNTGKWDRCFENESDRKEHKKSALEEMLSKLLKK